MIDRLLDRPSGPHPTSDELYRARHEPRSPWSEAILAHAATCAECSEELVRQEAFDTPEPLPERRLEEAWIRFQLGGSGSAAAPAASRAGARPWRQALLLAATLAACGIGLSLWKLKTYPHSDSHSIPPPPPTTLEEAIRGGGEAAGVWTPTGRISGPPTVLVFSSDGETPVRVIVFDEGRSYSWTSPPTASGRIPFPAAERAKLRPGVDYYWTLLTEGTTPSDETARSFRIEAPPPPGR